MPINSHCRRAVLAVAILLGTVVSGRAAADGSTRIRSESALLRKVFASVYGRSGTFRSLVERIERSDVIVHLTCSQFNSARLAGQTLLGAVGPDVRYVRVQVSCRLSQPALVMIVAHELQHVVEIASTPAVVDSRSFARLFLAIGFSSWCSLGSEQFETRPAIAAGELVQSEYFHDSESGAQASRGVRGPDDRRGGD